jgi:predicted O-methyltransferase YrrM
MMIDLAELNKKFNTDKGGKHCYLQKYYQPTFSPLRESTRKVLEIGVYEGASIRLWREFFINSEIYALEILQKRAGMFSDDDKIHLTIGSSMEKNSYENIPKDLDIIIDDGSHKPEDQYNTFRVAYTHLKQGGVYVIEDVRDISRLQELMESYKDKITIHDFRRFSEPDTVIFEIIK